MRKYAVIGNPIKHSLSPQIHKLFAKQFNIDLSYERIEISTEPGELLKKLKELQQQNYSGLNVTLPFKQEVYRIVQNHSQRAQKAKAVNVIVFKEENNWFGDNTDGLGLILDFKNFGFDLENKKILIVGAGGATQGILEPLILAKPSQIIIANRTQQKAEVLVKNFSDITNILMSSDLKNIPNQKYDLIINATSAGHQMESFDLISKEFAKNAFCYDISYGKAAEPFLLWAKKNGANIYTDGLGMLVGQAAESFNIWHGKMPETKSVIQLLRDTS